MNIQEVIQDVKQVIKEKKFKARREIKDILLKNCKFLAEEYDPFDGELKSLYMKNSNFIIFKEETTHRKGKRIHNAFKLKVIGPYHKQMFYVNILGPVQRKVG